MYTTKPDSGWSFFVLLVLLISFLAVLVGVVLVWKSVGIQIGTGGDSAQKFGLFFGGLLIFGGIPVFFKALRRIAPF